MTQQVPPVPPKGGGDLPGALAPASARAPAPSARRNRLALTSFLLPFVPLVLAGLTLLANAAFAQPMQHELAPGLTFLGLLGLVRSVGAMSSVRAPFSPRLWP